MKIKKFIIATLLGLSALQVVSTANADITNQNNWQLINTSVTGSYTTCYWKRALIDSNGEYNGQYEYYNYKVATLAGCFSATHKLPR